MFLTKFASKVTLVHRRDQLRASKIMQDRAFANPKIEFVWNSEVTDVKGDGSVESLRLLDTVTGAESDLEVSGMFVAIGHDPNTALFREQLELDENDAAIVCAAVTLVNVYEDTAPTELPSTILRPSRWSATAPTSPTPSSRSRSGSRSRRRCSGST